jgi:hypothetical protein
LYVDGSGAFRPAIFNRDGTGALLYVRLNVTADAPTMLTVRIAGKDAIREPTYNLRLHAGAESYLLATWSTKTPRVWIAPNTHARVGPIEVGTVT